MKTPISLHAFWGNDDADSQIHLSDDRWHRICQGEKWRTDAESWYEGTQYKVTWHFNATSLHELTISNEDGGEHYIGSIQDIGAQVDEYDGPFAPPSDDTVPAWPPNGTLPIVQCQIPLG